MAVDPPASGDTITKSSITSMHEEVRSKINNQELSDISRAAFGPHALPSLVVGSDFGSGTSETLAAGSDTVAHPTTGDIGTGNWKDLTSYVLNGPGVTTAGYELPPCKVLIFFNARVKTLTPVAAGADRHAGQLWYTIYHRTGGANVYDMKNVGMIQCYEDAHKQFAPTVEETISMAYIIDQTAAPSNWTLQQIGVKAGLGRGKAAAGFPINAEIIHGFIGFIAFYRDS